MMYAFIAAILVLFAVGWVYAPKGVLTKITSSIWLSLTAMYEFMQEQFLLLREIVPPDFAPWFLVGFLGLTIAAAVRPSKDNA